MIKSWREVHSHIFGVELYLINIFINTSNTEPYDGFVGISNAPVYQFAGIIESYEPILSGTSKRLYWHNADIWVF